MCTPRSLEQATRKLASEITSRGASLYELLGHEVELREERSMAIARPLDIDEIERGLQKNVTSVIEQYNHYLGYVHRTPSYIATIYVEAGCVTIRVTFHSQRRSCPCICMGHPSSLPISYGPCMSTIAGLSSCLFLRYAIQPHRES